MNASRHSFAAVAVVALLSGCATDTVHQPYGQVHPIGVEATSQMLELPADGDLSTEQEARLEEFARLYLATADGQLTIAYPKEQERVGSRAARDLDRLLRARGVDRARIRRGAYSAETDGDRGIVLSFSSTAAYGAACPDFLGDPTRHSDNGTPRYYGCATQNNLAAMIERPTDLLEPRAVTPADARRRQLVLENYRLGRPTGAESNFERTQTTSEE